MNFPARLTLCVLFGVALAGCLAGCKVGPDYHQPKPDLPTNYGPSTQPVPATEPVADLHQWWSSFNDPTLTSLIDRAVQENLDLKLATARIREARAARGISAADLFPVVDVDGSYTRARRSLNVGGSTATSTGTTGTTGASTGSRNSNLYEIGFDSTWELDVFGGVRREVESADATIQSTIENRRDVLVTLLGDVAVNYINLRASQRQLSITRDNLKSQEETVKLTQARFNAGIVGELDVARAKALADTTASQIPSLQAAVELSMHRLGVLLGKPPSALWAELDVEAPIPTGVSYLPIGLPSDLLRRRADIRQAERNLAAQNAQIGVATADLFPHFSLTGSLGLESLHSNNLAKSNSLFWNFGPGISWNIFDAGKIRSNIAVQDARTQQLLVTYQQTVLNSLQEVEDAMANFRHERDRRVSLDDAAQANRRAVQLANDLYSRGLTDFLSVQQAQRDLLTAEDQLAQSEAAVSSDLVALYKALGGGWETFEEKK